MKTTASLDYSKHRKSEPRPTKATETGRTSRWGLDEGDLSLIDWMLEMTPTERLRCLQSFSAGVEKLRRARRI